MLKVSWKFKLFPGRTPDSLQPRFFLRPHSHGLVTPVLSTQVGCEGWFDLGQWSSSPPSCTCGWGSLRVSQSQCMGDLISPSVLPLKCFHDNFKDNGMFLESMETVSRMQCHHEYENFKSCLAWMTLLGSCYPMTRTHLRPWNTEKLVTSNPRTDAKTPNDGRGWHHTSNYPSSAYFNLKYVVKNEVLPFYIQQCPRYSRGSIKCR